MKVGFILFFSVFFFTRITHAQSSVYPRGYFRHPLNIKMELVANFGEIRTNHWHMGLDIRTQRVVNKPVFASAEGFISRVVVEPGGFGQAIYIDHPNGYTTLYAHLNAFSTALAKYVKEQQYLQESWKVNLKIPPGLFPVRKGQQIGLSGSTGGSQGPHVHFEIRDTKTENCLNPLLFQFPIPDAVPPAITRLAMYDRNRSTYEQSPQLLSLKKTGSVYVPAANLIRVGSNRISFAIGAVDRFTGVTNPNGIFSAKILVDGNPVSEFIHDDISYDDTRYINAQIDIPYRTRGGAELQHISPLPGVPGVPYRIHNDDGVIQLDDSEPHDVMIEVRDANSNVSRIKFRVQYDEGLHKTYPQPDEQRFIPNNVNIFEMENFELFTTERTLYDSITVRYTAASSNTTGAVSPLFSFLSHAIPSHDSVTVRIRPSSDISGMEDRIIIKNVAGTRTFVEKADWQNGWVAAKFRQFGTYQAFIDNIPPEVNAVASNLSKASRIVFTPTDNFNSIKNFRVELDGQWLRFTNDKGRSWIYYFDEKFPGGAHELKVTIEDEAGNVTVKKWNVTR